MRSLWPGTAGKPVNGSWGNKAHDGRPATGTLPGGA